MMRLLALLLVVGTLAGAAEQAWASPVPGETHETLPVEPPPPAEEIADAEGEHGAAADAAALADLDPHALDARRAGTGSGPPSVPPPR